MQTTLPAKPPKTLGVYFSVPLRAFKSLWHIFDKYVFKPIASIFSRKKSMPQTVKLVRGLREPKPTKLNTEELKQYLTADHSIRDYISKIKDILTIEDIDNKVDFFVDVIKANFQIFACLLLNLEGEADEVLIQVLEKLAISPDKSTNDIILKCFSVLGCARSDEYSLNIKKLSLNVLSSWYAAAGLLLASSDYLDYLPQDLIEDVRFFKFIIGCHCRVDPAKILELLFKLKQKLEHEYFVEVLYSAVNCLLSCEESVNYEHTNAVLSLLIENESNHAAILNMLCVNSKIDISQFNQLKWNISPANALGVFCKSDRDLKEVFLFVKPPENEEQAFDLIRQDYCYFQLNKSDYRFTEEFIKKAIRINFFCLQFVKKDQIKDLEFWKNLLKDYRDNNLKLHLFDLVQAVFDFPAEELEECGFPEIGLISRLKSDSESVVEDFFENHHNLICRCDFTFKLIKEGFFDNYQSNFCKKFRSSEIGRALFNDKIFVEELLSAYSLEDGSYADSIKDFQNDISDELKEN